MKRQIFWAILWLWLPLAGASAEDRYLIRVRGGAIHDVAARHGLTVLRALGGSAADLFVVNLPSGGGAQKLQALSADASVANVERDAALRLPETPASAPLPQTASVAQSALVDRTLTTYFSTLAWSGYVNQPAALITHVAAAHTFATGAGTVAVLDTGVDPNHPVLQGSLLPGFDFTRNIAGASELIDVAQSTTSILDQSTTSILDQSTTSILDRNSVLVLNQSTTAILDQSTTSILDTRLLPAAFGHGTMVAGIVHLVAPTAKILPVKVFAADGASSLSQIVAGIYYAVDRGAKVINMSFSAWEPSKELLQAIQYANSRRVICVASAGNDGLNIMVYPAGYNQVIGVGSTTNSDARSSFSNYGNQLVSMAAPGNAVITLYPGRNYAAASGTSFSAPQVAGGAALLAQIAPNVNQSQAGHALSDAVNIGQGMGAGRIDLYLACLYQALHGGN